jgi:hypothetical protein
MMLQTFGVYAVVKLGVLGSHVALLVYCVTVSSVADAARKTLDITLVC